MREPKFGFTGWCADSSKPEEGLGRGQKGLGRRPGGFLDAARGRLLGGLQEAPRRRPEGSQEVPRRSPALFGMPVGGFQETTRRAQEFAGDALRGTQEAPRRHPHWFHAGSREPRLGSRGGAQISPSERRPQGGARRALAGGQEAFWRPPDSSKELSWDVPWWLV